MAREIVGIDVNVMLLHTLCEGTRLTWRILVEFIKTYLPLQFDCVKNSRPKSTAFWARIFSDAYFAKLAAQHHPMFCGMMGAIMSAHQATGSIKEAIWFKKKENLMLAQMGFKWGKTIAANKRFASNINPFTEWSKNPGPWMELYEVQNKKSGQALWIRK